MKTPNPDPIDVLDVLAHEVGLGAAEVVDKPTVAELRDVDDLIAFARAELNRQARAEVVPVARRKSAVRPLILAMSRADLLARIDELRAMPGMRLAASHHRFSGHTTDDDLREAVERMESLLNSAVRRPS